MAKKKITPEAQYVKNILKYGNPYGPMPNKTDMRVGPVRKFVVPGSSAQRNVLAEPLPQDVSQPVNVVGGGPSNAYGGVQNVNQINMPGGGAGPGQADVGNPAMASMAPGWGATNQAPSLSSVLSTAPFVDKTLRALPQVISIPARLVNNMAFTHAQGQVDNFGQNAQTDPTGAIVGENGLGFDTQGNPVSANLSSMTGANVSGMFGELDGMDGNSFGVSDGAPDAIGAED